MPAYIADLELDRRDLTADHIDAIHDALGDYDVSVATTPHRTATITLTIPATTLRQATQTALALAGEHGQVLGITVLREDLRDAREGWAPVPELVSVSQAAELLEVSRQRVLQMLEAGKLPATRVGRDWVLPADAVRNLAKTT